MSIRAEESGGELPENCLPKSVTAEHFDDLMQRSPFLRTLDFADTYRLRGVATIEGQPVALLVNRETEETVQVTSANANKLGMVLVAVDQSDNLSEVAVRLSVAGEEVKLSYTEQQVSPQLKAKAAAQRDSRGNLKPPQRLVDKYRTMTSEQRKKYHEWRTAYIKKHPESEHSEKRYEIGEKVVDAIKSGKGAPPVR